MMKKFLVGILLLAQTLSPAASIPSAKVTHPWRPLLARQVNSLSAQNQEIDRLRLPRVVDDRQLNQLIANGELVKVPENVELAPNLKGNRTYVRYWTQLFLASIGEDFNKTFGKKIRVNSAIRTREQQQILRRYNSWAARPDRSAHTSGTAIDLAKRNLTRAQYRWVVAYLSYMRSMGLIAAQEEPQCFHVAVMEKYDEYAMVKSPTNFLMSSLSQNTFQPRLYYQRKRSTANYS